ncbi:MAG TPA: patatin-like phospholipase family protein [Polyangiaceae bacterium]|nr:patatin-like phospholipase family protein [Polyangiaceae bacterium]
MKTRRWPRRAWAPLVVSALATGIACRAPAGVSSDRLLIAFNGGATDSIPDPALSRDEIAIERVRLTARRFLVRGYFTQGDTSAGPNIGTWLEASAIRDLAKGEVLLRRDAIVRSGDAPPRHEDAPAKPDGSDGPATQSPAPIAPSAEPGGAGRSNGNGNGNVPTMASDDIARSFHERLYAYLRLEKAGEHRLDSGPLCEADAGHGLIEDKARRHRDAARLAADLDMAAIEVGKMLAEGLVDERQALAGLDVAMDEAAHYLRSRRWQPDDASPTVGIALKGGASTGVYSAGATWRLLTMMQRYHAWSKRPGAAKLRFTIASGTSAGAIIAAVVDLFNRSDCTIDAAAHAFIERNHLDPHALHLVGRPDVCQDYARVLLATFFTRSNEKSLYCIDRRLITQLASDQKGLMDFTGLREKMQRYIGQDALANPSELVLTTVDFRWGELDVQSDQDPSTTNLLEPDQGISDVISSIEASFVLPFIAHPVDRLRVAGRMREGVFLDGGIKSEIPVIPLLERGVERALVVGSGMPRITPTAPQKNALTIAARYLDVSLSAVTEGDWNAVTPLARYMEDFERRACRDLGPEVPYPKKLCDGDPVAACNGGPVVPRRFEALGIFRRDDIDPTFGYTFDPVQMKRLFSAGAEEVRSRCAATATFLGMADAVWDDTSGLDGWCNETATVDEGLRSDVANDEEVLCAD